MSSSEKRYAGKLERWFRQDITHQLPDVEKVEKFYGVKAPFVVYHGTLGVDHKERGFDNGPVRTSLVVKESPTQIETLNSIYDLGAPRIV